MEFTCHPQKNQTFSEPFTKPAGHFQPSNGPKQWTHIVIWPRKKHSHTHTLTPDPCLGKQNAPLELWWPLRLLNLMAAALILQRFRFLGEPVSSLFVDDSKPISLYPKKSTIHQRRSRRLKYKQQNGFFSSCSVYLWSPLTQWIRVGIMILKPLYCKSKIQSLILGVHIPFIEANERWFDLNRNTYFARWISSNIEASHVKCLPSFLIKRTCTHMLFVSSCSTIYFPQHPFM